LKFSLAVISILCNNTSPLPRAGAGLQTRYARGAFGEILAQYNDDELRNYNQANEFDDRKFTGHFLEQEGDLGIYHAGARLYDPEVPRFYGVDAMRSERTWISPYNYVQNNPVNRYDPDGNFDLSGIEDERLRMLMQQQIQRAYRELYQETDDGSRPIDVVYESFGATSSEQKKYIDQVLEITFTDGMGPKVVFGNVDGGYGSIEGVSEVRDDDGNLVNIEGLVTLQSGTASLQAAMGSDPTVGTLGQKALMRLIQHEGLHVPEILLGLLTRSELQNTIRGGDRVDEIQRKIFGIEGTFDRIDRNVHSRSWRNR